MNSPRLQTRSLSVGYHSRRKHAPLASGLNLRLNAGALTCLVGPNGVGKSTLLRTLAGLQRKLAGDITIDDISIDDMDCEQLAKEVGVVLTHPVQPGDMKVEQVVGLGRLPYTDWLGGLDEQDEQVVANALLQVDAQYLAGRRFAQLSDGERQKVMVARALAQEPAVLLLDEPTAFLDWNNRVNLLSMLKKIARDTDKALLVSSHDLELVVQTADCLWVMDAGGQVTAGDCAALTDNGALRKVFPDFQATNNDSG